VSSAVGVLERRSWLPVALLVGLLCATAAASIAGKGVLLVSLISVAATVALTQTWIFRWESLVGLIIVVIFFIPIRRYELPANLPIVLEPYRIVVAIVIMLWLASLLVDSRVAFRRSDFGGPVTAITLAVVLSLVANPHRVTDLSSNVTKSVMFFASFLLVFFLIVSVCRRLEVIDALLKTMVTCGAIVAILSLYEFRTGYNIFDHLSGLPGLRLVSLPEQFGDVTGFARGGRLRVYASAQHPNALAAALTMLVPLAIYLAMRSRQSRWWLAGALCMLGVFATSSRTSVIMLFVIGAVYFWLRPRETRRLWPALIPLVLVIHVAAPGTLGGLKDAFFPKGGLFAQEAKNNVGSGRLATLGPTLHREVYPNVVFGEGFGTRIVARDEDTTPNAPILDDQWLGTLAETGVVGALAWIWLFGRYVRRLGRAAKEDDSDGAWLCTALAASVLAFAVGMLLYDAFSFIQVAFILWFLLGLGAAALQLAEAPARSFRTDRVARDLGPAALAHARR
jgi:O-antigen ligase